MFEKIVKWVKRTNTTTINYNAIEEERMKLVKETGDFPQNFKTFIR